MQKFILVAFLLVWSIFLIGCNKQKAPTLDGTTPPPANVAPGGQAQADIPGTSELAQCLTTNGLKMYGTEWCSHCKDQKNLFGQAFAKVSYVDCDQERQACLDAGVRGFPTWIDSQWNPYPGTQTLARLAEIGGCKWEE